MASHIGDNRPIGFGWLLFSISNILFFIGSPLTTFGPRTTTPCRGWRRRGRGRRCVSSVRHWDVVDEGGLPQRRVDLKGSATAVLPPTDATTVVLLQVPALTPVVGLWCVFDVRGFQGGLGHWVKHGSPHRPLPPAAGPRPQRSPSSYRRNRRMRSCRLSPVSCVAFPSNLGSLHQSDYQSVHPLCPPVLNETAANPSRRMGLAAGCKTPRGKMVSHPFAPPREIKCPPRDDCRF